MERGLTSTICAASLVICLTAGAEDAAPPPAPPAPGGDALTLDEYYGDPLSRVGSFPGTLVCISTKQAYVPENVTPCGTDKVYALAVEKPNLMVPVVGAAERAAEHFAALLDKKVVVRGKHYPDKGMIAASSIERATTAADAPGESAP